MYRLFRMLTLALIAGTLVLAGCGDPDPVADDGDPGADQPAADDEAADTESAAATDGAQGSGAADELTALAADSAFAGGNDEAGMAEAVAAFNAAGLDFSPDVLASAIPESCQAIDADAVGEILGVALTVDTERYPLPVGDGYLSCTLKSAEQPDVAMAYVHLSPDLNGGSRDFGSGWGAVGTMEGAFELPDLGDGSSWSDGSRGDNLTNKTMLQLLVEQGGTQSYLQLLGNEPQLEIVGSWSAPKMIPALAAINDSLR